jgi:hypothetical protein
MATPELTDEEHALAETLAVVFTAVSLVQEKAAAVRATGGDCKLAFMSAVPEDTRGMMEMQWPMVSMMLGV